MSEPLEDVQDAVLERLHAGQEVDRDVLIAAHPEHAEALRAFFGLLDQIEAPPPVSSVAAPSRLGEFRILREIGRGGMGVVYEAEQSSLRRKVALKVLPPSLADNPRIVARFRRESEAAGRLRHPNIVPVYSVGQERGTPFFAMELVAGRSLADILSLRAAGLDAGLPAVGAPWRRWVLETVAKVADALEYAHGEGILHRDVKPGNILLETNGTPRLTDFGLALDLAAPGLTMSGESLGTPLYMSPEQAMRREAPLDPRTDVYSLGVTLYEALTLRTPYEGVTAAEVFAALRTGEIVPPRVADPTLPAALETVLVKALQRDPAARYPSAAAFAVDVRAVIDGRPAGAPEPAARSPRARRRGRLALLGAAAVLVAAAAFFALRPGDGHEGRAPAKEQATTSRASKGETPWKLVRPDGAPEGVLVSQAQIDEAKRLAVPVWFENSIGMRFVLIPAGKSVLGAPEGELGHNKDDETPHEVEITKPYYVGVTEVTNAQYRAWNPLWHSRPQDDVSLDADDQPASSVEIADARGFAAFLTGREGRTHRLPTEAEWEHAARAGTTGRTFWGDDPQDIPRYANTCEESAKAHWPNWTTSAGIEDGFPAAAPVGSLLPNPWGLYDVLGNASEWCTPQGRATGVLRGSGWGNPAMIVRCGVRAVYDAEGWDCTDGGFRLVCDLPAAPKGETPWDLVRPEGAPEGVLVSQAQIDEAKRLSVPVWFENSIGMRFVLIPAGKFRAGPAEADAGAGTGPQREVAVAAAFYLQTTETSNEQYRTWRKDHHTPADNGLSRDAAAMPVGDVRAAIAGDFAGDLSKDGRRYRLPSDVEWEYACRAGTTTRYFWGAELKDAARFANLCDQSMARRGRITDPADVDDGFPGPSPVGSFAPNPWGLFDMTGNESEMCRAEGSALALCGGSWSSVLWLYPAGTSWAVQPAAAAKDGWGFRLACDLQPTQKPEAPWKLVRPDGAPEGVLVSQQQIDEAKRVSVPVWFENSIGMRFVLIPAGKFTMGSAPGDPNNWADDQSPHEVVVPRAFYAAATETTNAQMRKASPFWHTKPQSGADSDDDDRPAGWIDRATARSIATFLTAHEDRTYRLPTEEEWEYAARAGSTGRTFWDEVPADISRYANTCDECTKERFPDLTPTAGVRDGSAASAPVGSFLPNPWGLYDVLGNVCEWCESAPGETRAVHRGCGWAAPASTVHFGGRGFQPADNWWFIDSGFRLVCDLPSPR